MELYCRKAEGQLARTTRDANRTTRNSEQQTATLGNTSVPKSSNSSGSETMLVVDSSRQNCAEHWPLSESIFD